MRALSEEHTGRTVQLAYDYAFCAVDDESAGLRHIRNRAQIYILDFCCEILVIRIGAVQFEFGLERHAVGQTTFEALLDSIAGRVDIVVKKLQHKVVACVGNGEILCEHLIKAFVVALFRGSVELQKVAERLQLHLEKIGVRQRIFHRCEIHTGFI